MRLPGDAAATGGPVRPHGGVLQRAGCRSPLDGFLRDYRRCRCHRPRGPAHMRRQRSQADAARAMIPPGANPPSSTELARAAQPLAERRRSTAALPPPAVSCTCISTAWTQRTSPPSSTGRMILERWHRGRCSAEGMTSAWPEVACGAQDGPPHRRLPGHATSTQPQRRATRTHHLLHAGLVPQRVPGRQPAMPRSQFRLSPPHCPPGA